MNTGTKKGSLVCVRVQRPTGLAWVPCTLSAANKHGRNKVGSYSYTISSHPSLVYTIRCGEPSARGSRSRASLKYIPYCSNLPSPREERRLLAHFITSGWYPWWLHCIYTGHKIRLTSQAMVVRLDCMCCTCTAVCEPQVSNFVVEVLDTAVQVSVVEPDGRYSRLVQVERPNCSPGQRPRSFFDIDPEDHVHNSFG